jgi:hypothetical protein
LKTTKGFLNSVSEVAFEHSLNLLLAASPAFRVIDDAIPKHGCGFRWFGVDMLPDGEYLLAQMRFS